MNNGQHRTSNCLTFTLVNLCAFPDKDIVSSGSLYCSLSIFNYSFPMIATGQPAPDFKLFSADRTEVALSDYKGKNVVLLFFPMAFTSVCTAELCEMRDNLGTYADLNADVLAISVDSPFTLAKFRDEQALPFPLLSDFNKEVSTAYDSIYENFVMNMHGVSKRAAFVIDAEGVVQYAEVLENAGNTPDFKAIQAALVTVNS